jgi:hypothetical protein
MESSSYKSALQKAQADWAELTRQEAGIAVRKAQLKRTIKALAALCSELPDISAMSLADAIRLVIASTTEALSVIEIRGKLNEIGYDLSKFKTPLASIHTAVNRMVESEELIHIPDAEDDTDKKVEAGKNLKAPFLSVSPMPSLDLGTIISNALTRTMKETKKE